MRQLVSRYRVLLWCLVLSLVLHFTVLPQIIALLWGHRAPNAIETIAVKVSSLRIVRRPPPPPPKQQPVPQLRMIAELLRRPVTQAAAPLPQHRELAKITPRARIAVPRVSTGFDPNAQQAQFEKTIAQLRSENNPLAGAAEPVGSAAPAKHYAFDFSGSVGAGPHAEGILTPVKSWRDGPYTYYYVRYYVEYADGTTETGYVPWPIRYLPADDPFARHWEHFPLPGPLPDYSLPPETNMHPLVAFCYEHRTELSSCPIEHD